jgi:hypothetical protein
MALGWLLKFQDKKSFMDEEGVSYFYTSCFLIIGSEIFKKNLTHVFYFSMIPFARLGGRGKQKKCSFSTFFYPGFFVLKSFTATSNYFFFVKP